ETVGRDFPLERRRSRGRTFGARGRLGGRGRRRRRRQRPLSLDFFQEFSSVVKGADLELGRFTRLQEHIGRDNLEMSRLGVGRSRLLFWRRRNRVARLRWIL